MEIHSRLELKGIRQINIIKLYYTFSVYTIPSLMTKFTFRTIEHHEFVAPSAEQKKNSNLIGRGENFANAISITRRPSFLFNDFFYITFSPIFLFQHLFIFFYLYLFRNKKDLFWWHFVVSPSFLKKWSFFFLLLFLSFLISLLISIFPQCSNFARFSVSTSKTK